MNTIIAKLKRFSEKQPILLGSLPFVLFVFSFFLTYGYYLFDLNVPGFSNDTIQYFNAAFKIIDGEIPMQNLPVDIPIGYPLFISFFLALKIDIIYIIYGQITILFFSSLFLIYEVSKINKYIAIFFSLMMSFWIFDPILFNYNTCFYPDSLYASALVLCTSFTMRLIRKNDLISLVLLSISIVLACSIRSNGLVVYFIPVFLIIRSIKTRELKNTKLITVATIISLIVLSFSNYIFKDYFFPGDLHRIQNVSERIIKSNKDSNPLNNVNKVDSRSRMFFKYLFNSMEDRASFYFTHLRYNHVKYENNKKTLETAVNKNEDFVHLTSIENESLHINIIMQRIFDNHKERNYSDRNINELTDVHNRPRNIILSSTYYIQTKCYQLFFEIPIVIIAFVLLNFWALFMSINKKNPNKDSWQKISWIPLVYWLSIITLVFTHYRVQNRYIVVSEFIIYLAIALFANQIFSQIIKKSTK